MVIGMLGLTVIFLAACLLRSHEQIIVVAVVAVLTIVLYNAFTNATITPTDALIFSIYAVLGMLIAPQVHKRRVNTSREVR